MNHTYGQRAVGLDFNPSQSPEVLRIKQLFAEVIDMCNDARAASTGEQARLYAVAITEAQTAQMWAVKAATWDR